MLFVLNEDDVTDETSSQQSTSTRSLQQKDHLRYIRAHVNQRLAQVDHVYFDRYAKTATNGRVVLTSKGLRSGQHSWSIKILKCDVELQELGVISNANIHGVDVADGGLRESVAFGAKGLYGNEMGTDSAYYGTWNEDGKNRCFKDLGGGGGGAGTGNRAWCTGDVIKVCVDLERWRIKFLLNGNRVKKVMSLQSGQVYHPVLSFAGNCEYKLLT